MGEVLGELSLTKILIFVVGLIAAIVGWFLVNLYGKVDKLTHEQQYKAAIIDSIGNLQSVVDTVKKLSAFQTRADGELAELQVKVKELTENMTATTITQQKYIDQQISTIMDKLNKSLTAYPAKE